MTIYEKLEIKKLQWHINKETPKISGSSSGEEMLTFTQSQMLEQPKVDIFSYNRGLGRKIN